MANGLTGNAAGIMIYMHTFSRVFQHFIQLIPFSLLIQRNATHFMLDSVLQYICCVYAVVLVEIIVLGLELLLLAFLSLNTATLQQIQVLRNSCRKFREAMQ